MAGTPQTPIVTTKQSRAAEKSAGRDEAEEEGEEQIEVEDGEDETMADVDEAIEEIAKLEEEMQNRWDTPPFFEVG